MRGSRATDDLPVAAIAAPLSEQESLTAGWRATGSAAQPAGEGLTLGAVSHALHVPVATIKLWEWRHQLPIGTTGQGGEPRYTRADVAILGRLRDETAAGRGPAETEALAGAAATAVPEHVVDRLLAATHRLHTGSIEQALQQCRRTHGLTITLEHVVLPALHEIGRQWADGQADVAHEHLLAGTVQTWLTDQQRHTGPPRHPGTIVLACGPDDQHTVALEAFALLLADQGVGCRHLGARTPISALVHTARQPSTCAVVVASYLDSTRAAAVAALHAVTELPVSSFYAGAAFTLPAHRRGLPGTYLGETLSASAHHLTRIASYASRAVG